MINDPSSRHQRIVRTRSWVVRIGSIVAALLFLAILMTRWLSVPDALRAAAALPFLLFIPGYALTWIAFPTSGRVSASSVTDGHTTDALDPIERATLAVLLSIVITSGVVFVLAKYKAVFSLDPALTPRHLAYGIVGVTIALTAIAFARQRRLPWWVAVGVAAYLAAIVALRRSGMAVTAELAVGGLVAFLAFFTALHVWRTARGSRA